MKRFTLVITIVLAVMILTLPLSLYFVVFEKPIKGKPN